jgi:hypothetical protein
MLRLNKNVNYEVHYKIKLLLKARWKKLLVKNENSTGEWMQPGRALKFQRLLRCQKYTR